MFYCKNLKKFKGLKHCFFSRKRGFSKGFYKGLNCGRGSNDNKVNINKNLKYVSTKMKVKKNNLILMHQTHSNRVKEIKKNDLGKKIFSDAMITKINGIALGVVTADCVPVLLFDRNNKIAGCIHAGWRGAFSNIIKNTVKKIRKINKNNDIFACVGPCIGKNSYEVDINFYKKFVSKSKKNKSYFLQKNKNKKLFNLRKFVSDKLLELNIQVDHIKRDTYLDKKNFFSYRRSSKLKQNDYGRCISVISLI